ncbi:oligopeptide/dipeptide ABC transporter ATP-binding protein, partial [Clostridium bowmanii]|uniref:oligopeptide/dipeptide ABC transporter ATP-binding protein n=1 Tax=Clostridium bowmanii TaxID=132925 RepID=UPI0035E4168F|nr:peptide ABC transporter ATP-binding protein [Clostridium bowmanii]
DKKLSVIPGTPPNLKHPLEGCRFAERCKYVKPECSLQNITPKEFAGGRMYRCIHSIEHLKEVYADE